MKYLSIIVLAASMISATSAHAEYRNHRNSGYRAPVYSQYHGRANRNWALPLLGGAIIGGIIANEYYQPHVFAHRRPEVVCERYRVVDRFGNSRWAEDCWQE